MEAVDLLLSCAVEVMLCFVVCDAAPFRGLPRPLRPFRPTEESVMSHFVSLGWVGFGLSHSLCANMSSFVCWRCCGWLLPLQFSLPRQSCCSWQVTSCILCGVSSTTSDNDTHLSLVGVESGVGIFPELCWSFSSSEIRVLFCYLELLLNKHNFTCV